MIITLAPPPQTGSRAAADVAWGHVRDGIRAALTVPNLSAGDRERLRRCYDLAAIRARQSRLSLKRGGED